MARANGALGWARSFQRAVGAMARSTMQAGTQAVQRSVKLAIARRKETEASGHWIAGLAMGPAGTRRYRLFRPAGVQAAERLPLLVMLHGCGQDADSFALSTRMNRLAARERFLVLYPEQDRRVNPQGCWNWYGTRTRGAYGEAAIVAAAVDQVCLLYPVDPNRIAIAGLSAGASMAALCVTRYPQRFKAIVMHSGIPPGTADSTVSAVGAMRGRRQPVALETSAAWPPLLVIHGNADAVVSAHNGHAAARLWADAAKAQAVLSRHVSRGKRHPMRVTDFKTRGRTVATLCEIHGLGHAWSGGNDREPFGDGQGPDASRMVWAFAARQFRAR